MRAGLENRGAARTKRVMSPRATTFSRASTNAPQPASVASPAASGRSVAAGHSRAASPARLGDLGWAGRMAPVRAGSGCPGPSGVSGDMRVPGSCHVIGYSSQTARRGWCAAGYDGRIVCR